MRYAILILPAANRVYAVASIRLLTSELAILDKSVLKRLSDIQTESIAGLPYITFTASELTDRDISYLANLSSIYALFKINRGLLEPVDIRPLDKLNDDLITIQKYSGKTNEYFTKLLLNVTLLSTSFSGELLDRKFHVFDPLCGRGTTLNQSLMYGFDASGIDLSRKDFDAYSQFIQTWLKSKRIKHRAELGPLRKNRRILARQLNVTFSATKEEYKKGQTQRLCVVNADTSRVTEFFKPASFDAIVTDAPYGIQHRNRSREQESSRNPIELLTLAIPGWSELLKPGGAFGISWNTYLTSKEEIASIMQSNGLDVLDSQPYGEFQHRVDHAINRDILIARKREY